jgi:long-chain acyl-CoA synthetase
VYNRIDNYGKGLLKLGLSPQQAVGVYAVNRPEWVSAILKCNANLMV